MMNTVDDASADIALRSANHGTAVIVHGPGDVPIASETSAQLIGRVDFVLSEANWSAVQARLTLHEQEADTRYALMMEPAVRSRHPGEGGGEGGGCTSVAAMCIGYSGAVARSAYAQPWTRKITFGERTIGAETYNWGSHILAPWPTANVSKHWFGRAAVLDMSAWTYPRFSSITWDYDLYSVGITDGTEQKTNQTQINAFWYDPDYMYYWARNVYQAALADPSHTASSLGVTWRAKSTLSPDALGGFPYIEMDATGAFHKPDYDTCADTLNEDWSDVDDSCEHGAGDFSTNSGGGGDFGGNNNSGGGSGGN
jgi:hypothetical protein